MGQLFLLVGIPNLPEADDISLIFSVYELMHANLEVPIKKICFALPVQLQAFAHTIVIVQVQLKQNMTKMRLRAVHA